MKNWLFKICILFTIGLVFRFIVGYYINTGIFIDIIEIFAFATYFNYSSPKISILSSNLDHNNLNYSKDNINTSKDLLKQSVKNSETTFTSKCKCKIYWVFLEKNKTNYKDYRAFELLWNSNKEIRKEINSRIHTNLENHIRTWKVQTKTLLWFLGNR